MRYLLPIAAVGTLIAFFAGCDLLDPTNAENPNVTEDDFLRLSNSSELWLQGLERQMAAALDNDPLDVESGYIVSAELTSDNYVNTATFFNQFLDQLTIDFTDDEINLSLRELADLRETAEFGLNIVVPGDEETRPDQEAEMWFFKAMAHLYTGEAWHLAPMDSAGSPVSSAAQFEQAVESLVNALDLSDDAARIPGYQIALARAYRNLGDVNNARIQAGAAIAGDPSYLRFAIHDFTNGPNNDMQDALFDRGTFDDLQPLPRLDFLDPKYFITAQPNGRGDDDDADVAFIKAEEAFLILAEALLADGDIPGAQIVLGDLIALVDNRPVRRLVDSDEGRTENSPGSRPNDPAWRVAASPDDELKGGLVISRSSEELIPIVSGTSVTDADVNAAADLESLLEILYLMRQEIFIAEGRRMADLGIKWPVTETEVLSNPNINPGDPATQAFIPAYLPPGAELDAFNVDETAKEAVILHNLNRLLVENRASDDVLPFF